MSENNNKGPAKIIIILSLIIAAISAYVLLTQELPNKPLAGKGQPSDSNELEIGGSFSLVTSNGEVFTEKDLEGKISLIYFGFTFCPDICPTSLHKLNHVIDTLDRYQIEIQPIFITIDPTRDTKDLLKEYLAHFNPKIIGLTGSEGEVKDIADKYKVYYAKSGHDNNHSNYMLDHTSFMYLIDSSGRYVKHFYLSDTEEDIIEFIRINKNSLK